jgi:ribosome-associated protein
VNVVVHLFQNDRRQFYDIESLWGDAEIKEWPDK